MSYVRNAWYVVAWAHEVVPEHPLGIRVLNEPIVVWRSTDGLLTVFEDRCVHRLARLSLGRCEGQHLRCMYHGLLYDRSGKVVDIPGQTTIPPKARVRVYPVAEKHSWVWVWMGVPEAADEGLIPPAIGLTDPDYILSSGQLDYAAEARLVNDNLLDLSHLSFVHASSFRQGESWARERPKYTPYQRSVREERWLKGVPRGAALDHNEPVDKYFRSEFYVPGVLLAASRCYSVGTATEFNQPEPDLKQPMYSVSNHAVTPMTDRSTRYFFSVGADRQCIQGSELEAILELAKAGFAEDKRMIEAQQQIIDATPSGHQAISTTGDQAIALFSRIVSTLVHADAGPNTRLDESQLQRSKNSS